MRIRSVRIALALGLLCAIGAFFACTTTPENGNRTPTNQNQTVNQNVNQASLLADVTECDNFPDPKARRAQVEGRLNGNVDNGFKDLVKIKVQLVDGKTLRVLVEGAAEGNDRMPYLVRFLEPLMKEGCVRNVYFVRDGTITSTTPDEASSQVNVDGFRWGGCEGDMYACPNGVCVYNPDQCDKKNMNANTNSRGTPAPNTAVNSGGKGNSNSSP